MPLTGTEVTPVQRFPTKRLARAWDIRTLALVAALCLGLLSEGAGSYRAVSRPGGTTVLPRVACASLAPGNALALAGVTDFSSVVDAPTRVLSATVVGPNAALPEHCDIRGYVASQVMFELRLPTRTWNGRYFQTGCGGFCGTPPSHVAFNYYGQCDVLLGQDFANGYDDTGHVGVSVTDGLWAVDSPSLRDDYAYRSEHDLALAARAIIQAYYGQPPRYSYFNGCSDGGREALMEAQRYPDDFDGVIAGAPGMILAPLALFGSWKVASLLDDRGVPVFTPAKLAVLHDAVIARCDGADGLVDGQIDDPRSCTFDPASLRCPGNADGPTCLTAAQLTAAIRLYQGPVDAGGRHLYPGGEPLGSELGWGYPWTAVTTRDTADGYFKYLAFPVGQHGPANYRDVNFDTQQFDALRPMGLVYNAVSASLSAFRRRGGKLIIWQGWADDAVPPTGDARLLPCGRGAHGRSSCKKSGESSRSTLARLVRWYSS
jgi:hypothetical protein